eukprot:2894500-Prymnesium_polylepis.1
MSYWMTSVTAGTSMPRESTFVVMRKREAPAAAARPRGMSPTMGSRERARARRWQGKRACCPPTRVPRWVPRQLRRAALPRLWLRFACAEVEEDLVARLLLHPAVQHRHRVAVGLEHVAQRLHRLTRVHKDDALCARARARRAIGAAPAGEALDRRTEARPLRGGRTALRRRG